MTVTFLTDSATNSTTVQTESTTANSTTMSTTVPPTVTVSESSSVVQMTLKLVQNAVSAHCNAMPHCHVDFIFQIMNDSRLNSIATLVWVFQCA